MPQQQESLNTAPVDRAARDALAATIRQWLHEEITEEELRQTLAKLQSDDPTLEVVGDDLELYSQVIALNEPAWRHVQRLLLVLASQLHIEEHIVTRPRIALQSLGVVLLLCPLAGWFVFGVSRELAIVWVVCGLGGAGLTLRRMMSNIEGMSDFHPFSSEEEMQQVARTIPQFQLEPPPDELAEQAAKKQTSLVLRGLWLVCLTAICVVVAPIVLLLLIVPGSYRGITERVVPELPA